MSHLNVYIMNKVRKLLLVCGCFLGSMSLSAEVTSGSDFEILMQKIRQDFSKNPSIDEALSFYREGAFTDVDYGSIQIRRIRIMLMTVCLTRFRPDWSSGMNGIPGVITGGIIR